MRTRFRRRNYFTKKNFQSRFILRFLLLSCLWNILAVMLFNVLASRKIDSVLFSMRLPTTGASSLLLRETVYANLVAVSFTVIMFAMAARGIYSRIVRSLYRIRADLLRLERGDLGSRIMLSDDDEFRDFAGDLNFMVAELQHRFGEIRSHVLQIRDTAKMLKDAGGNHHEKILREKMLRHIDALDAGVKEFRT